MHPADSASTFEAAVTAAGMTVENLGATEALAQMTKFYRDVRADNCILDEEGDTLLCEWGMYEEGAQPEFLLEFSRHFIEPGDEDEDGMSQLSLTLHYPPTPALEALRPGTQPCTSPSEAADFARNVLAAPPCRVAAGLKPLTATLEWFPL